MYKLQVVFQYSYWSNQIVYEIIVKAQCTLEATTCSSFTRQHKNNYKLEASELAIPISLKTMLNSKVIIVQGFKAVDTTCTIVLCTILQHCLNK